MTAAPNLGDELAAMVDGVKPSDQELIGQTSPARSAAGRIRNVKAMSKDKLGLLAVEMATYRETDPDAYWAVIDECARRGAALRGSK